MKVAFKLVVYAGKSNYVQDAPVSVEILRDRNPFLKKQIELPLIWWVQSCLFFTLLYREYLPCAGNDADLSWCFDSILSVMRLMWKSITHTKNISNRYHVAKICLPSKCFWIFKFLFFFFRMDWMLEMTLLPLRLLM